MAQLVNLAIHATGQMRPMGGVLAWPQLRGESHRSLRKVKAGELCASSLDRLGAERKHAQMILARLQQGTLPVLECRHSVARRLFGVWRWTPNHVPDVLKLRSLRLGNPREILVERGHLAPQEPPSRSALSFGSWV
jgi:hypothetical protein